MTAATNLSPEAGSGRDSRGGGLYARVVDALGQDIVDGRMKPGEVVFAEQLCQLFGVSRSVVRESLRTLSSMGLVEARPQVGTRVLPSSQWDLLNPRIVYWRGRGPDYLVQQREILELRLGAEPAAARLAASRITDAAAQELIQHAEAMLVNLEANDPRAFFEADALFHRTLMEGSGNSVIAQLAGTISAVLAVRSIDSRPGMKTLYVDSVERHLRLARAVAARDESESWRWAYQIVEGTIEELDRPLS